MLREALLILLGVSIHKAIRFISHSLNSDQVVAVNDSSNDDVILHQTVSPLDTKYDVFLSFRGEDTRQTFASHLYKELHNLGIHTFMDHELHKGEEISQVLLRTIEESEISMIIFSKNFASSTWCMDELVHILDCKEKFRRVVIPIYYEVDPSNIRKQNGSFGNGFDALERRFRGNQEKLQKWKDALIHSTSLCGWHFDSTRPESKFVEEIAKDILSKLSYKSSCHLERLVGITHHIENVKKLLNEASVLGIWGMGGSGKTTLAKALFQELKSQFKAFSYVENVKEQLSRISLDELQKNCLKELLKDGNINIYDIKSDSVKSRLQRQKVLLILDDVDNSIMVEDLTKVFDWFGEGSRIILISRNMQVLKNASKYSTYHVPELDFHHAFHLFSLKVFKQDEPSKDYMELSKLVVEYCQGNPLALVVLGCFLYGRGKEEWESALEKLNEAPLKDIVDVLKLSFDGLDDKQKNVFLDLVFLIKERVCISWDLIRQLYGSSGHIDISVLREKSLISFNIHTDIEIHNLMRKMGLEIGRQQLFSSLKTPIRLWRHEDIDYFFSCDKEIERIRCLSVDLSKISITWRASNFRKMCNLIFFKVYKSNMRKPSELTICGDLDYLPEKLRFFSWQECPLPNVPLHFCAENLITLDMPKSNIVQLWNGNQHFPNLKKIFLSHSKHLTALPDLSHAPKVECVDVEGCVNLDQIYSSTILGNLENLWVEFDGPKRINIGGSMKGPSSRLVMVFNYLDLNKLSLNKVRMEVLLCGDIICGVRLKVVEMLVAEIAIVLGYLLPFVRKVGLLEGPIECGHDFRQHYDYEFGYDSNYLFRYAVGVRILMRRRGDRGGERHVVGPSTRENMIMDDNQREMINDYHQILTEVGEGEEEEEELMREYYCGGNNSNATIFTRVPNSITHWSLLTGLKLGKCDMVENSFSHASCNTLLDMTVSLHIQPSAFTDTLFQHDAGWFRYHVGSSRTLFRNYEFIVEYVRQ